MWALRLGFTLYELKGKIMPMGYDILCQGAKVLRRFFLLYLYIKKGENGLH